MSLTLPTMFISSVLQTKLCFDVSNDENLHLENQTAFLVRYLASGMCDFD